MNNDKKNANPFNLSPCHTPELEEDMLSAPNSAQGTPERTAFQKAQLTVGRAAFSMAELTESFASSMISAPPASSNTLEFRKRKSVRTGSPAHERNLDVEMNQAHEESRSAESAPRPGAAILTSHNSFKKLKEDSNDKTNKQLNNNKKASFNPN